VGRSAGIGVSVESLKVSADPASHKGRFFRALPPFAMVIAEQALDSKLPG